jgi:[acyl-carrier-protein] S-malonyltransferase
MKFAFVFPGQGSQSVGMMNGYNNLPIVQQTFIEASDTLKQDFWSMANNGPAENLNLTVNTQPLMLTAGIAVYRAWINLGGTKPSILAGHSLGEYTALVAAEALDFADALKLVHFRAQAMQQAVPEGVGGMAAILGLEDEVIKTICREITQQNDGKSLEPANFNSPGQIVIAGHKDAVLEGIEKCKAKGAKRAIMLPMSIPSHCSLMKSAANDMQLRLEQVKLQAPKIPILHNADVKTHTDIASIKEILVRQLINPVRWVDTVNALAATGISHLVECGPGKVLIGLNKRIEQSLQHLSLTDTETIQQAVNNLKAI